MTRNLNFDPRKVANSSGFPLQIRVGQVANSVRFWRVYGEEIPWRSALTGSEGYIDLVLNNSRHHVLSMIVECKRVIDTVWVFLIPDPKPDKESRARLWLSNFSNSNWVNFEWYDFHPEPESFESKYCAIPGQEKGRRNLIENVASELTDAVEAFACQRRDFHEHRKLKNDKDFPNKGDPRFDNYFQIYVPVIVTTAQLQVAFFDPEAVSLCDGSLPDNAVFAEAPYVRFRKSLTTRATPTSNMILQTAANQEAERTIYVVNTEKLEDFLTQFSND